MMRSPFPLFKVGKAADMIRLLKLFQSSRLTNEARMELIKATQNLAADLVVTNWPRPPAPARDGAE